MRTLSRRTSVYATLVGTVSAAALLTGAAAVASTTSPTLTSTLAASPTPSPASSTKTHPMYLPTAGNQWLTAGSNHRALQPPAPPCPESGLLPAPFSNCGLPEFPAVGQPYVGNMAYWGGHVQVNPKVYLVYFGWGRSGAFSSPCQSETFSEGSTTVTLPCDPDGAGKRMADFTSELGGTHWAGLQSQYYQTVTDASGAQHQQFITNPANQLAGVWVDDTDPIDKNLTYTQMAQEAARAVAHFGVTDLADANFVIAQPQNFSDPQAQAQGYCAFHDYTEPQLEGGIYNGIQPGISYTNMPYVLNQGSGCGQNIVNSGAAGKLDGFTVALGHEIEETVTDPGAEDILPNGTVMGGWFDPLDANENGDKCAYVGYNPIGVGPNSTGEPGSAANITGNRGDLFPVQSLWSNQAASGVGYCAGDGTDLPVQ